MVPFFFPGLDINIYTIFQKTLPRVATAHGISYYHEWLRTTIYILALSFKLYLYNNCEADPLKRERLGNKVSPKRCAESLKLTVSPNILVLSHLLKIQPLCVSLDIVLIRVNREGCDY